MAIKPDVYHHDDIYPIVAGLLSEMPVLVWFESKVKTDTTQRSFVGLIWLIVSDHMNLGL